MLHLACARCSARGSPVLTAGHCQPLPRTPTQPPACPWGQQDVPGQEVFPTKQREMRFSGGPWATSFTLFMPGPETQNLPVQRLPAVGREWAVLNAGTDPCAHGLGAVFGHGGRSRGESDPKGHECRDLKKRDLAFPGPLPSALPSVHPSAATTTARPGPASGITHLMKFQIWQREGPASGEGGVGRKDTGSGRPAEPPGGAALEAHLGCDAVLNPRCLKPEWGALSLQLLPLPHSQSTARRNPNIHISGALSASLPRCVPFQTQPGSKRGLG